MSDIADDERDYLEPARTLIRYLDEYQRTHRDPILLVFDSKNEYLAIEYRNRPSLKVIPVKDADEYIKAYLDKTPSRQRRNVRVVSSDNSVYYYAKDSYATAIRAEEFWDKLYKSLKPAESKK